MYGLIGKLVMLCKHILNGFVFSLRMSKSSNKVHLSFHFDRDNGSQAVTKYSRLLDLNFPVLNFSCPGVLKYELVSLSSVK